MDLPAQHPTSWNLLEAWLPILGQYVEAVADLQLQFTSILCLLHLQHSPRLAENVLLAHNLKQIATTGVYRANCTTKRWASSIVRWQMPFGHVRIPKLSMHYAGLCTLPLQLLSLTKFSLFWAPTDTLPPFLVVVIVAVCIVVGPQSRRGLVCGIVARI